VSAAADGGGWLTTLNKLGAIVRSARLGAHGLVPAQRRMPVTGSVAKVAAGPRHCGGQGDQPHRSLEQLKDEGYRLSAWLKRARSAWIEADSTDLVV